MKLVPWKDVSLPIHGEAPAGEEQVPIGCTSQENLHWVRGQNWWPLEFSQQNILVLRTALCYAPSLAHQTLQTGL